MVIDKRALLKEIIMDSEYNEILKEELFSFNDEEKNEIKHLIDLVEKDNFSNTKEKGITFENIIKKIFKAKAVFCKIQNLRTGTNEIDISISIDPVGTFVNASELLELNGNTLLIEGKNYAEPVGVTWIGKFAHLMQSCKVNYGIIFSKKKITGIENNKLTWKESAGLCKKLYLKENRFIINITLEDIKFALDNNINFFNILENKKKDIKFDTNYFSLIQPHVLSGKVNL